MLATPFTPVTECPLNTLVTTSTITIAAADNGKSLSVQGGSAVVNGVAVTSFPVTLHTGNTLAITTTSASTNDTATFVTVAFGGQQYIVTFVTQSPYSNIFDTDMYAVPFYQRTNNDGSLYNSTVHTYSVANSGVVTEMQTTATPSQVNDTTYQVMILDPYNDEAHLVGSDGVLVQTYNMPDATWTGASVFNVGKFTFWFGMFHNKQVGITLDGTNFTYLTLSASPVAIASNLGANYIWVACYDGSIYCFQNTDALTFTQVAQVKLKTVPTSMVVDDSYNLYVVSMGDTVVTKFSPTGSTLGSTTVGNMPIGIAYTAGQIFVSCAEDQKIVALSSSSLTQTGSITLTEFPGLITIDPTNTNMCVTCLSSKNVYRFKTDSSLAQVDVTTFSKNVLAAYSFDKVIIADHLQYDARPYTRSYKSIVPGLGFFENDQEPVNTAVVSTTVTATELEVTVPISIPTNLGASIVLNGSNIGTSGIINNNDQFYITFTTPSTGNTFTQIPVSVGNYVEPWNTTTAAILTAPNPFFFAPINTSASNNVSTPSVTIGGLTPGSSVTVSTSNGTLLKNGVAQSGSFSVVNGDTIQLQLTSSASANGVVSATVTAGSFATTWNVFTALQPNTSAQYLTNQPISTAVVSDSWVYANTKVDPVTQKSVPTSTTITFPPGVVVKVNGTQVGSGATIYTNDTITVGGVTSAQYYQPTTFAATTADGWVFKLQATTIANVVPYPMDFGVLYNVAPGSYYQTLDCTVQNINAAANLSLQNPGSFLISDGDTGSETVKVNNGTVVGLSIRGQASLHNQMYTIPVYALGNDGVTQVVCGSVRIVPMVLKGSIDYPYEGHEETNLLKFFRYKEGVYAEVVQPASTAVSATNLETSLNFGWIYEFGKEVESGYMQTWTAVYSAWAESGYMPWWTVYDSAYAESQYSFTMYDGTAPYWETDYAPGWYFYETGKALEVSQTYQQIRYADYHETDKGLPKPSMPTIGNGYEVRGKAVSYKYGNQWEVKIKTTNYKNGVFGTWSPTAIGNIKHTIGEWGIPANAVLPGYWLSNMPVPVMVEHIKILTDMPTPYMPPGCMKGLPDMPSSVYEIAKMVETGAPQPIYGDSAPSYTTIAPEAESAAYYGTYEMGGMTSQVSIVAMYEVGQGLTPISYNEEVTQSVQNPTLFGGFADQASAQQFITDNNIQNGIVIQLSNGYWMVISTTASQDLACAIAPPPGTPGSLRPIAWLLQGG